MELDNSTPEKAYDSVKLIAEFMDIDPEQIDLINIEFNHKYSKTIIKVNNTFIIVDNITYNNNMFVISGQKTSGGLFIDVPKTIEEWNPEVGLYIHKNATLVFIKRLPERQFLKSFRAGFNYVVTNVVKGTTTPIDPNKLQFEGIHCIFKGTLYLLNKPVGLVKADTIYLYPVYYKHFFNDIKELCPNYNIISLDVSHLQ